MDSLPRQSAVPRDESALAVLIFVPALLLAIYAPMIWWTAKIIVESDDMAQGLFAPVVAIAILWQKRNVFTRSATSSAWGIALLLGGALLATIGAAASSTTASRLGFLFSVSGCILNLCGPAAFRSSLFAILLLLFTFPIPQVFYGDLTAPLQSLATRTSEYVLEILGYTAVRSGNILELPHYTLSVVEACSGLRSLLSLVFLAMSYVYFVEPVRWLRVVVTLAAIPAAMIANVIRIATTGVLGEAGSRYTTGVYHELLGWTCFAIGFAMLYLFHRSLSYARRRLKPA